MKTFFNSKSDPNFQQKLADYHHSHTPEKIYLHTDKPFYAPGESIWFSGYLISEPDTPLDELSSTAHVQLLDPKESSLGTLKLPLENGKFNGGFKLDKNEVGGLYKIKAYTQWMKDTGEASFEKTLQVQTVIKPRLLLTLDFTREAYGSGDEVVARLKARDLKDRPIALRNIHYKVQLGGQEYSDHETTTDGKGEAELKVTLPQDLQTNDGLLSIFFEHEGTSESISRAIPIVLNNISVDFFPEGGNWVAGISNKMAFKAVNEFGKPADIEGIVLNKNGQEICQLKSFHQGMGAFDMQPALGENYQVKITKPSGISTLYPLPKAQKNEYGLGIEQLDHHQLKINAFNPNKGEAYLIVQSGHQVMYKEKIQTTGLYNQVISTEHFPIGISRVSLFDAKARVRCERLVFINPHKQLKVTLQARQRNYQPRQKVEVDILTTNEQGIPVAANLSVAVVDDKIITLAHDKQDDILSGLLMSAELKGKVHEPNFYFQPDEPKATPALDFVMMTHGWRKYQWADVMAKSTSKHLPKKISHKVRGQVINVGSKATPGKVKVVLFELGGAYRKLETITGNDGKFVFNNIPTDIPIQLFAQKQSSDTTRCKIILADYERPGSASSFDFDYSRTQIVKANPREINYGSSRVAKSMSKIAMSLGDIDHSSAFAMFDKFEERILAAENQASLAFLNDELSIIQDEPEDDFLFNSVDDDLEELRRRLNNPSYKKKKKKKRLNEPVEQDVDLKPSGSIKSISYLSFLVEKHEDVQGEMLRSLNIDKIESIKLQSDFDRIDIVTSEKKPGQSKGKLAPLTGKFLNPIKYSQVRVFRPKVYEAKDQSPKVRNDFRNTIYWNPIVQTDKNGEATLTFCNNDSLTTFRVIAEGLSQNQQLGRAECTYSTKLPFELTAKIPPYFLVNDQLALPVYLTNNTDEVIEGELQISSPQTLQFEETSQSILLPPQTTQTVYLKGKAIRPWNAKDTKQLLVKFAHPLYNESYTQLIKVLGKGFPMETTYSGNQLNNPFTFRIPPTIDHSLEVKLVAYPNILDDLMDSIASILKQPYGCFEQASASTYPNILALQFLEASNTHNASFKQKAMGYIKEGYNKLIAFETSQHGFEWFGASPPHEGLSAFGLLEFLEMKKVYPEVDDTMIKRTKKMLLSRRDGKGGFHQNQGKYGFTGASEEVTNAYLVYALAQAGVKNLEKEYAKTYAEAKRSEDAYRMALLSLASTALDQPEAALDLLNMLRKQVKRLKPGNFKADHSLVRSYGRSLQIEVAALIALAEMNQPTPGTDCLQSVLGYLMANRNGGYFGSTQGTILALQALTKYAALQSKQTPNGRISVYQGDEQIAHRSYNTSQIGKVEIAGLEEYINDGENNVLIKFEGVEEAIPFGLNVQYSTEIPNSSPDCNIELNTQLNTPEVVMNQTVRLTTTVKNKKDEGQGFTMALVGIPSGLSPQPWQLKALQEDGKVDFYEIKDSYIAFYFREMAPNATETLLLDLKAEIPGTYKAPASVAYLYYTSEHKHWQEGTEITIKPERKI